MNRRTLTATAVALALTAAATAAIAADDPATTAAAAAAARAAPQPDRGGSGRGQPVNGVVAPPKPTVETIVQPGVDKIPKHERVTDVLKARKRAGGTDRVVAD
jgi:hypothetical protein